MFITFEGIDGSGKSTQVRRLAAWLREQERAVETMRDPGGTHVAEQVRTLLLDAKATLSDRAELFLFAAARAQLVEERIRPALKQGRTVLCDRFYDSTTAYQGGGRRVVPLDWMKRLHEQTTGGLVPDRTYLIDVPVGQAVTRRHTQVKDRMERESQRFYEQVRKAYQRLAASEPERICQVDGTGSPAQVHSAICTDLQAHCPSLDVGTPS